jgi:hypothetical protein
MKQLEKLAIMLVSVSYFFYGPFTPPPPYLAIMGRVSRYLCSLVLFLPSVSWVKVACSS